MQYIATKYKQHILVHYMQYSSLHYMQYRAIQYKQYILGHDMQYSWLHYMQYRAVPYQPYISVHYMQYSSLHNVQYSWVQYSCRLLFKPRPMCPGLIVLQSRQMMGWLVPRLLYSKLYGAVLCIVYCEEKCNTVRYSGMNCIGCQCSTLMLNTAWLCSTQ